MRFLILRTFINRILIPKTWILEISSSSQRLLETRWSQQRPRWKLTLFMLPQRMSEGFIVLVWSQPPVKYQLYQFCFFKFYSFRSTGLCRIASQLVLFRPRWYKFVCYQFKVNKKAPGPFELRHRWNISCCSDTSDVFLCVCCLRSKK